MSPRIESNVSRPGLQLSFAANDKGAQQIAGVLTDASELVEGKGSEGDLATASRPEHEDQAQGLGEGDAEFGSDGVDLLLPPARPRRSKRGSLEA